MTPAAAPATDARAELALGLRSAPYLEDHAVHDMALLPGSFYVTAALHLHRELFARAPGAVWAASFHHPVVLAPEDSLLRVQARPSGDGRVRYEFSEASDEGAQSPAATLEIAPATAAPASGAAFSAQAFQARADAVIAREHFYARLHRNGNRYGPRFQGISSVWRAGDEALALVHLPSTHGEGDAHARRVRLLDSLTQVPACFALEEGRTLVLRSIAKIETTNEDIPETLWGHATLRAAADARGTGLVADVQAFDASGRPLAQLSGIAFGLAERADADGGGAAASVVVAANFTAEPLQDALQFWGTQLGAALRVEFAPYNQVFQQLLDPGSALRANRDGINVVLLRLEAWAARAPLAPAALPDARARQCLDGRRTRRLPNGLEVAHLHPYETDYLYKEIFEDQCYLRHGIRLEDGDTVVDIGANIGLFSLFVLGRCARPEIYAFEPAPPVFDLLRANCDAYGPTVRVFNDGVAAKPGTATFTFYENASVFSGFHADAAEDGEAMRSVVRNVLAGEAITGEAADEYVDELTAERLRRSAHECRLTTVSEIMRRQRIDRIQLLKIDAEKSELDILEGIEEADWPRIEQLVMEIHDRSGEAAERIAARLRERGYRCALEQEPLLRRSGLCHLYATRRPDAAGGKAVAAPGLARNAREFCAALRSFMQRSAVPLLLCVAPRSPAASAKPEVDAALDEAEQALLREAGSIANVHAVGTARLLQRYRLGDCFDADSHQAGDVPYTPEGYAAFGTEVARALFARRSSPYKVIALDCDNTLWQGACGEDGPQGVEITAGHRALQSFMVAQAQAGMLLCLCSRNNEQDVLEVFARRDDMPLRRAHLVAWRINWDSKARNLRALADELGLGLESFIFIDDSPLECAQVRIGCPEVLTLQLPPEQQALPAFLDHVWAFDRAAPTEEDRSRARMYQENAQRRQFQAEVPSLKDFVDGLQLHVEITDATPEQLGRVAQLTLRTNQFNFNGVRRSESEVREFLRRAGARCLAVRVADRFGDYGLVGAVLYEAAGERLKVDTFLLSCRVLGRGVEHAVAAWLGRRALEEGRRAVEFAVRPGARNRPALEFIAALGGPRPGEDAAAFSLSLAAEKLASVTYDPPAEAPLVAGGEGQGRDAAGDRGVAGQSARLQRIAEQWTDAKRILEAIEAERPSPHAVPTAPAATPGGTPEAALVRIWAAVLGRPRVGLHDNFFDAGGTSLKAVRVVAMIKRELGRALPVVSVFECPTVALLAARLGPDAAQAGFGTRAADAALRGARRRRRQSGQAG